jgi:IS5 family transposase
MAIRRTGQLSLADALARQPSRLNETLERVQSLIDWTQIDTLLAALRGSHYGAPGYSPLLMFKALLLQQWYALSDPGLEEALIDRLSFRRFVGLALGEASPDHSTISRFRAALVSQGLSEAAFEVVNLQIDAKGLILRQGTIIDATLVEAHVKRPRKPKEDKAAASAPTTDQPTPKGERPASKLILSPTDPEASWAKKGHTRYFGYKGHVAVDQGSGIIRRCILTTASVADTTMGDALIMGDERALYADKGYDTKARRAALKAAGAKDRIAHRPNKHHPLSKRQEQRNDGIAFRRAPVERVFAIAKHLMGWRRVRYIGLARNAGHFDLLCTAINLKRLAVLSP